MLPLIQVLDTYSAKSIVVPDASLRSASNIRRISRSGKNGRAIFFSDKAVRPPVVAVSGLETEVLHLVNNT